MGLQIKKVNIYLKAMEPIATGKEQFTCIALKHINGGTCCSLIPKIALYVKTMGPQDIIPFKSNKECIDPFTRAINQHCKTLKERIELRLLLLAMMDACQKDFV